MASKPRSSEGCWTCRLRRKKCDEVRPVCMACDALEISCLYSEIKPEWMDGAEGQKVKADELKAEVKRKAAFRRERKYLQSIENGIEDLSMTNGSEFDMSSSINVSDEAHGRRFSSQTATINSTSPASSNESANTSQPSSISMQPASALSDFTFPFVNGTIASAMTAGLPYQSSSCLSLNFERELNSVMMYLDYVFPFQFPFYRPPLLQSGRGWLLVLLLRDRTLFHISLSLASYYFSVVLSNTTTEHDSCKVSNLQELVKQQDLALKEMQKDMDEINRRGIRGYLQESARVMESMIQLLCFEVAIGQTGNWQMHLEAAMILFEQINESHAAPGSDGTFCWSSILEQLASDAMRPTPEFNGNHPWNSDQAAIRFFTSYMLYADIIASTALEEAPRLQKWHPLLLQPQSPEISALHGENHDRVIPALNLEEFIGVQNPTLILIGRISELAAWKKEMKQAGQLSVVELVSRATQIETDLRRYVTCIDAGAGFLDINTINLCASSGTPETMTVAPNPLDVLGQYQHGQMNNFTTLWVTRIWAQAALTYLSVVVSGWQPGSPEIRESVGNTISLLSHLPTTACLRTAVWPFCIAGCLAMPEQEHVFRDMVGGMGSLEIFGTIKEALAIMENVWANRVHIEKAADSWDFAASLRSLGRSALLV
ncbi:putative c6 transcription protein [Phaeoacremonium minimum UCRPA7]|uniref:Putative c6 transcription protein n=1 Tax=Phaeoacremonium minimum (strain UCR-PA7) TaxID=1286976 RepID=R8B9L8_PHAM7|nr:putative c6 transcription protein [Phaeoacremonium minimum UCRPA7]EON96004.1 putative c6 transcription protein [Phaeoacremonium minimum UCRPA7]